VFTLRLPDGRLTVAREVAQPWEWAVAFGRACRAVELQWGLEPGCGVACVAFSSDWGFTGERELVHAA